MAGWLGIGCIKYNCTMLVEMYWVMIGIDSDTLSLSSPPQTRDSDYPVVIGK